MALTAIGSCTLSTIMSASCSAMSSTISSSVITRAVYAFIFFVNSIISWLSLSDWAISKLDLLRYASSSDERTGFVAVHRINSGLGLLFLIMAGIFAAAPDATPPHKLISIQNGYWRTKLLAWMAFIVIAFFIDASFWVFWGNYLAPLMAFAFIFLGLVLLVDFAHIWAETCLKNIEFSEYSQFWQITLVGSTVGLYIVTLILTVLMYVFFASTGCSMNQAAITVNLLLSIIVSAISIHPTIQEANPQAGLAQSSMVAIYCTYLTLSAVAAEPDDRLCNPLIRSHGARTASIVLGALFTFLAIAYTTTRAANTGVDDDSDAEENTDLRRAALERAVAEGTLPASALNEVEWEAEKPGYNFILFHIAFLFATQYTATLLTMNIEESSLHDFVPVGRTYFACWLKILSSWICYGLYSWTLVAPIVMPDAF